MEKEVILTNTGKLGDFLYCLPIASWLNKAHGIKIHWVLPSTFGPFNHITNLLMMQPFTSRVSIVPFQVQNFDCGGQPYKFDPYLFRSPLEPVTLETITGRQGEYYNLGFRHYPNKYISAFYAEEYGFDYDRDYVIELGRVWFQTFAPTNEVLRSTEGAMEKLVPHATPMGTNEDLLSLARQMAAAKEVHTWNCGLAILCYMARIPVTVHRVPGHASIPLYYEGHLKHVTFVEHEAHP